MKRRYVAWLQLTMSLVFASVAHADAPPKASPGAVKEAKEHETRAARLDAAGLFERAEAEYRAAFDVVPRPADLQKVAEMQEKRGAAGAAADTYEELAASYPKEGAGHAAARKLKALEPSLGKVELRVNEAGAVVDVRDRAGLATPLARALHFAPGRHRIVVEKPGFERVARDVDVTAKETTVLDVSLEPFVATGHVVVRDTRAANVHVVVDGADMGPAPWEGDVAPGVHRIELAGARAHAAAVSIEVERRAIAKVDLTSEATTGHVRFVVRPITTEIAIDGAALPNRGLEADLTPGEHLVVAKADGFSTATIRIHVEPGTASEENVALARAGAAPDEISDANGARDAKSSRFRGGFFSLAAYESTTVSDTSIDCGAASCSDSTALGGGLRVGGGYAIGAFELELALAASLDHRGHSLQHDAVGASPAYDESVSMVAVRGLVGVGPRVRTPTQWLSIDAGVVGGLAYAFYGTTRDLTGGLSDQTKDSESMVMPGGMADVKLVLGKAPGVRFALGFMALADFPGTVSTSAIGRNVTPANGGMPVHVEAPAYRIAGGTELMIGPTLGIVVGH